MELTPKSIRRIELFVSNDISHSSYLVTALDEFCNKNNLKLDLSFNIYGNEGRVHVLHNDLKITKHHFLKVCYVRLTLNTSKKLLLAFDFSDSDVFFSLKALERVDYYFKRTYTQNNVELVREKFKTKVLPLGIPFMVRPDKIKNRKRLKIYFILGNLFNAIKFDKILLSRLSKRYTKSTLELESFITTRTLSDFQNYSKPKDLNSVFYQKRLFPNEKDEDTREVHRQRIGIVRLLKKQFPNHFIGGIKNDKNLHTGYKDCASSITGSQAEFLKITKESGICIYTRGLANSIGWTLPEFMSQGKAIIAEKQFVKFNEELVHGKHLLYFSNSTELEQNIKDLLSEPLEIERLSRNSRAYYEENISPKIYFRNILEKLNA
ncbi:hypothetical protein ES731_01165 [Psychroflexus gondwanensis]|uniref:glycosyltransferase n=1 Tax=Psychroflexus gondwanensis TaxID=251 RepID=UPI0011BE139B|nr:hypothetical protein [Psychroflexus gondwanensis]TXE21544.1 hypothetical protein ES731_01165 [Psychroflexus gondwanensis]